MTDFPDRLSEIIAEYKSMPMAADLNSIYEGIVANNEDSIFDWVRCFPVHTEKLFTMRVYRGSMTKAEISSIFFHALHRLAERVVAGSTTPRNHGSALHYQFRSALREITRAEQRQERIQGAMEEALMRKEVGGTMRSAERLLGLLNDDLQKKCVRLHILEGKSLREVGFQLGIGKSTVQREVQSGLKSIREAVDAHGI